ncbi:hypothetical protein E2C01_100350 [Portunus trituberculatus]|uniref:Uncharacterized protein n=1 Tax=Portunus trituberculatus TaxID=210409 RepID=A0A5B7K2T7_PORTR|nr:hypothetical protein [Portunus trituberculatus]
MIISPVVFDSHSYYQRHLPGICLHLTSHSRIGV